jgi:hypothetical protein
VWCWWSTASSASGACFGWERVAAALVDEYARHYELVDAELDEETLALARQLAPEHRPLVG